MYAPFSLGSANNNKNKTGPPQRHLSFSYHSKTLFPTHSTCTGHSMALYWASVPRVDFGHPTRTES